jgi:20S proteasome alpha/beta subunit
MSLVIALYVPTGIVVSADSRTIGTRQINTPNPQDPSQTIQVQTNIVLSDHADKVFEVYGRFGIGAFGDALVNNMPIAHYVEQFEHHYADNRPSSTEELANNLLDYFRKFKPLPKVSFVVVGYDDNTPFIYGINVAENNKERYNVKPDGSINYSIVRGGEADIVNRLLSQPEFNPPFQVMNLQDAVDYSRHLIRSTIDQMRYEPRFPNVGGSIDTLLVTSTGARFLKKKDIECS